MKKIIYILAFFLSFTAFSQVAVKKSLPKVELSKISVYPNPFNDKTTVFFNSTIENENVDFIVQDLLGNIIHSEKLMTVKGKNTILFYRNNLSAGIYIYNLKTKDKITSKRFVIK